MSASDILITLSPFIVLWVILFIGVVFNHILHMPGDR